MKIKRKEKKKRGWGGVCTSNGEKQPGWLGEASVWTGLI